MVVLSLLSVPRARNNEASSVENMGRSEGSLETLLSERTVVIENLETLEFILYENRPKVADGSDFGQSLAPWFGPDFEYFLIFEISNFFRSFDFSDFFRYPISDFQFSDIRISDFFIIAIYFSHGPNNVYEIWFRSVKHAKVEKRD